MRFHETIKGGLILAGREIDVFQLLIEFSPAVKVLSVSNPVVPLEWPCLRSFALLGHQTARALRP